MILSRFRRTKLMWSLNLGAISIVWMLLSPFNLGRVSAENAQSKQNSWNVEIGEKGARALFESSDLVLEFDGKEGLRVPIDNITEMVYFTSSEAKRTLENVDSMRDLHIIAGGGPLVPWPTRLAAALAPLGIAALAGLQALFDAKSHYVLLIWQGDAEVRTTLLGVDDDSRFPHELHVRTGLPIRNRPEAEERLMEELKSRSHLASSVILDQQVWTPLGELKPGTYQLLVLDPPGADSAYAYLQCGKSFDPEKPLNVIQVRPMETTTSAPQVVYRNGGDFAMLSEIRLPDRTLEAVDQTTLVFKKAKVWLPMGNKIETVVLLLTDDALLLHAEVNSLFASRIPWGGIRNLSYEKKRVAPGGAVGLLKRHWLILEWSRGLNPQWIHIRLDRGNYEEILRAVSRMSGLQVDGWEANPLSTSRANTEGSSGSNCSLPELYPSNRSIIC